jgi:hypothetical protein
MFYRSKFVTNSSSSSYIGWGYMLDDEDLDHLSIEEWEELRDVWTFDTPGMMFITDEYSNALIMSFWHTNDDGFFTCFSDTDDEYKRMMKEELLTRLKKYKITPKEPPCWIFAHIY